ncbi:MULTISPECIES: hypothetical protein [Pseudomonas syringae group]|uniref:Uncharacterized protein n=2 Tax=Pseudomonas syringae group TaxID=136849 RepID=A0ABX6HKY8_9PSED|nr:hypothetical protein [Pseudomonas asturiensis]QHF05928.1 hypothetical protein N015_26175 [Pseudomonas asturiensis]
MRDERGGLPDGTWCSRRGFIQPWVVEKPEPVLIRLFNKEQVILFFPTNVAAQVLMCFEFQSKANVWLGSYNECWYHVQTHDLAI